MSLDRIPITVPWWCSLHIAISFLSTIISGYSYVEEPRFVERESNVTVHEGDVAILPCAIYNVGTKQVAWRREHQEHFMTVGKMTWIKSATHSVEHGIHPHDVTTWNLVIKNVKESDAGMYECQISSTNDYIWHVRLTVIGPVIGAPAIFVQGRKFVDEGDPIRLVCNATGGWRTPEDIDWFKGGDKIGSTKYPRVIVTKHYTLTTERAIVSELMVDSSRPGDSGMYICRSSRDDIASILVTVLKADSTSNVKRSDQKLETFIIGSTSGESSTHTLTSYVTSYSLALTTMCLYLLIISSNSSSVLCLTIMTSLAAFKYFSV